MLSQGAVSHGMTSALVHSRLHLQLSSVRAVKNKNRLVFLLFSRKRRQKMNRILMILHLKLQMIIVTTVQMNMPTTVQHQKTVTLKRAVMLTGLSLTVEA